MVIKLFNMDNCGGFKVMYTPSMINIILNEFYKYATNNTSQIENYKYSDIKCEYMINLKNEKCNLDPRIILDDLKENAVLQFKKNFKILKICNLATLTPLHPYTFCIFFF